MPAVIEGVSETNTPYDALFRAAFVDPQTARELTLFLLPERHASRLAGARVTVEPESLVDRHARTHRTDLLLQFDPDGSTATGESTATVKSEDEVDALMAAASRLGYHEVEGDYMTFAQAMLERGLEKGSLQQSREVLIRLVDRKFGLTDAERERIMACEDQSALDAALDEFAMADSKSTVLERLS
ncbi:MAG: hypothetical protein EA382_17675 [Spirochaetaceae bacterium]|nr:MAG: hypothetical protein EA382_17675 [Spirochaetaceae bacterium]